MVYWRGIEACPKNNFQATDTKLGSSILGEISEVRLQRKKKDIVREDCKIILIPPAVKIVTPFCIAAIKECSGMINYQFAVLVILLNTFYKTTRHLQ